MPRCIICGKYIKPLSIEMKNSLKLKDKSIICKECCDNEGMDSFQKKSFRNDTKESYLQFRKCQQEYKPVEYNFKFTDSEYNTFMIDMYNGVFYSEYYDDPMPISYILGVSVEKGNSYLEDHYEDIYNLDRTDHMRIKNGTTYYMDGIVNILVGSSNQNINYLRYYVKLSQYKEISVLTSLISFEKYCLNELEKIKRIIKYNIYKSEMPIKEKCEVDPKNYENYTQYNWRELDNYYKELSIKENELLKLRKELLNDLK